MNRCKNLCWTFCTIYGENSVLLVEWIPWTYPNYIFDISPDRWPFHGSLLHIHPWKMVFNYSLISRMFNVINRDHSGNLNLEPVHFWGNVVVSSQIFVNEKMVQLTYCPQSPIIIFFITLNIFFYPVRIFQRPRSIVMSWPFIISQKCSRLSESFSKSPETNSAL